MAQVTARHILVETEEQCNELKQQIADGADFADVAKEHSTCPSKANGGDLGAFGPGQMVPEFDQVVFNSPMHEVQGPVKTQFGYHLLEVTGKPAQASARHILVDTEEKCNDIKQQIAGGADFGDMAQQFSSCPSKANGGDLGSFGPGQMVPEFDEVVFSAPVNEVQGPVKTQFGYHLLEVTERTS